MKEASSVVLLLVASRCLSRTYPKVWLGDPRFLIGLGLFAAGFLINRQADRTLRHLRHQGQAGYKVLEGGL